MIPTMLARVRLLQFILVPVEMSAIQSRMTALRGLMLPIMIKNLRVVTPLPLPGVEEARTDAETGGIIIRMAT